MTPLKVDLPQGTSCAFDEVLGSWRPGFEDFRWVSGTLEHFLDIPAPGMITLHCQIVVPLEDRLGDPVARHTTVSSNSAPLQTVVAHGMGSKPYQCTSLVVVCIYRLLEKFVERDVARHRSGHVVCSPIFHNHSPLPALRVILTSWCMCRSPVHRPGSIWMPWLPMLYQLNKIHRMVKIERVVNVHSEVTVGWLCVQRWITQGKYMISGSVTGMSEVYHVSLIGIHSQFPSWGPVIEAVQLFLQPFCRPRNQDDIVSVLRENHHASVVWNWYHWVAIAD